MTPKELVLDFYKNDLMLHKSEVTEFLHEDFNFCEIVTYLYIGSVDHYIGLSYCLPLSVLEDTL